MKALNLLACVLLVAASSFAAPGGHLVEAISDECETLNPIWGAGLRGMPEFLAIHDGALSIRSIDNGDDPYPSAEDMTSTYADQIGRALEVAEGPSVVAWIWLPGFEQWPVGLNAAGLREWFGVRVTASDADLPLNNGFYFPGIYLATDAAGPCLIARVGDGYAPDTTIGRIETAGWWTLGVAFAADGRTEYYAAPGRVALTNLDLLHVTPISADPAANRSIDRLVGNFIALRMTYPPTGQLSPDWRMDSFRIYTRIPPALPRITVRRDGREAVVEALGGSRGYRFVLQRSIDLKSWTTVRDFVSDGAVLAFIEPVTNRAFYRVARP